MLKCDLYNLRIVDKWGKKGSIAPFPSSKYLLNSTHEIKWDRNEAQRYTEAGARL